jgi:hypothetical protein
MTYKLEIGGVDMTRYVPDWGPPFPNPVKRRKTRKELARIPGPWRVKRRAATRARMQENDGKGAINDTVKMCRALSEAPAWYRRKRRSLLSRDAKTAREQAAA